LLVDPKIHRSATVSEVAAALRQAHRITAICHENPDGDTLGAAIAIALIADRLGIPSEIVSVDAPEPAYAFLPRFAEIRRRPRLAPDVAVVCDAATLGRVGRLLTDESAWFADVRIVNVDHHASSDYFGEVNLVDEGAAATCEVVAHLVPALGLTLDVDLATSLLAGIVRDSHGFADAATTAATLRVSADLVDAGAPLAAIHRHVHGDIPYPKLALWGRILATVDTDESGRIVLAWLTQAMLDETRTRQHDADGVVEFMARTKGADVSILLREVKDGSTRVSLRTTNVVDAIEVARRFDGGGHSRRAGFVVPAPVERARADVMRACLESLRNG
jgi:phosphoesterase RecJ-like protein